VGSSPRRRARAGKSRRRQTEEGVEAGVEVGVEVPGTRAVLGVEQVWPEEDQRRRSTVAEARRRWQLEWSGGSSTVTGEKGVNGFFLRTDCEGVGCTTDGCTCSAWSGGGSWSAASAVRWWAAEQQSCTRGTSVRTSARSAAHGELHVWRMEAEGSWQRSEQ
jgi:hypothetical protein